MMSRFIWLAVALPIVYVAFQSRRAPSVSLEARDERWIHAEEQVLDSVGQATLDTVTVTIRPTAAAQGAGLHLEDQLWASFLLPFGGAPYEVEPMINSDAGQALVFDRRVEPPADLDWVWTRTDSVSRFATQQTTLALHFVVDVPVGGDGGTAIGEFSIDVDALRVVPLATGNADLQCLSSAPGLYSCADASLDCCSAAQPTGNMFVDFAFDITCEPEGTIPCSFDAGPAVGIVPGTRSCSPTGVGACVPDCSSAPIDCELDLGSTCGTVAGTRTCGPSGLGPCTIEPFAVECQVDAGPPCGIVTGTQTCSSSGAGQCVPPGQQDCSVDFGPPCGELFGTLACDDPGATCMLMPKFAGCTVDLGGDCGEVLGVTLCDSSGPGECLVGETTEVECFADVGPLCGLVPGTATCGPEGEGECVAAGTTTTECSVTLPPPCGTVQGAATCGPEGEGECILPGNGTPETGYDTDNDCDGIFGECDDPHWECNPGLVDGRCPQGVALCGPAGATTGCIPLPSFDSDADGIEDHVEEQKFIDLDCDGTPDVFLPDTGGLTGTGVDPNVKDLLLELDWMEGEEPSQNDIARLKEAFALAPDYAGENNYPAPAPLAATGINLWVDTGSLEDPTTGNLVGDDLGGGNPVEATSLNTTTDGRLAVLINGTDPPPADCSALPNAPFPDGCPNLQPGRAIYFRYGLLARSGASDPDLAEDGEPGACDDGENNGADGADVDDPDCSGGPSFGEDGFGDGSFTCGDGIDNGADGEDRGDPDCRLDPNAAEDGAAPGSCSNGIDDNPNADGADALAPDWVPAGPDPQCMFLQTFQEGGAGPESCFDCIDNDGDGLFDALDPDCPDLPMEDSPTEVEVVGDPALGIVGDPLLGCSCWDEIDNGAGLASGSDGVMDDQDPDCAGLPEEDGAGFGSCWDGIDNGSGGFDGTDPDCQYNLGEAQDALGAFISFETRPGTLMHEFGHLLGLDHGGPYFIDGVRQLQNRVNGKPQYASIMNYDHSTIRGIYQGVKPDAVEGPAEDPTTCTAPPGTCGDGIDNDCDTFTDEDDWEDCRGGSDLNGDGELDAMIIDYAPPRFVALDGTIAGRGQDLTPVRDAQGGLISGIVLDEANLDEGLRFDPTDAYNTAWFTDPNRTMQLDVQLGRNARLVPVRMDGFNMYVSEDGMNGLPECYTFNPVTGAPENEDGTVPLDPNEEDPNCFGQDYDGDGNVTPGALLASNLNAFFFENIATVDVHEGANDWANLGLPASGLGSPVPVEIPPCPPPLFDPDDVRTALTSADVEVRFVKRSTRGRIGDVVPGIVQVRNLGPAAAKGVEVQFVATDGLELVGVPVGCALVGGVGSCPLGTLRPGQLRFLDVTVGVLPATPGGPAPERRVDAFAITPGDRDPGLENNLSSLAVAVVATCDPTTYEAEDAFHSAGELHFDGWKLKTQGHVSVVHPFTEHSTVVTVRAKGVKSGFVWPAMKLSIDGVSYGTKTVANSFYQDYVFEVTTEPGEHEVRVSFENPSSHQDRLLFLDRIEVECEPSCDNAYLDGNESDVDCGGSCGPTCDGGENCIDDNDCQGGFCGSGACETVSCSDGVQNGHEEGTDCGGLCPDECPTCGPRSYEAESMFHSTGGAHPEGWVIWDNGYISTNHAFLPEQTTLTVRAKGVSALGVWPHMVVSVGGVQVGQAFVTSSTWNDHEFDFLAPAGTHEVRVAFDNDYYAPPHYDRNLFVDRIRIECASSCDDEQQNGSETDVDCGGGECPTCADGSSCELNADCESENCSGAVCAPGHFNYDFETGTLGWTWVESPATSTTTTSLFKYSGSQSLRVNISGSGNPRVWASPPQPVPSGATVTFRVLMPGAAPITAVQPFVADAEWQWSQGWYAITGAMKGSWQTFTVNVSESASTPVQEVGIKLYLSGSYSGAIYVDRVEW